MNPVVICLTGEFKFGSKAKVTELLKKQGHQVKPNVTKKTSLVIRGGNGSGAWKYGINGGGLKIEKAITLGIPVMDEKSMLAVLS